MAIYQGHNEDSSGNLLLSIGNGMTATVETGSTASQSYTKGSYLFFNNRLCKAASAIASGATLTIGGNLTQTSLGAEITSHLRSSDGKEFYFDVKDGKYGYYPSASKTASEFVPFGGSLVKISSQAQTGNGSPITFSCNVGDYLAFGGFGAINATTGLTLIASQYYASGNPHGCHIYQATSASPTVTLVNGWIGAVIRLK